MKNAPIYINTLHRLTYGGNIKIVSIEIDAKVARLVQNNHNIGCYKNSGKHFKRHFNSSYYTQLLRVRPTMSQLRNLFHTFSCSRYRYCRYFFLDCSVGTIVPKICLYCRVQSPLKIFHTILHDPA